MTRFRLTFVLMAFAILSSGIAVPEDQDTPKGGTIIGDIQDTTLRENYLSGVRVVCVNADGAEFETQTGILNVRIYPQVSTLSIFINRDTKIVSENPFQLLMMDGIMFH